MREPLESTVGSTTTTTAGRASVTSGQRREVKCLVAAKVPLVVVVRGGGGHKCHDKVPAAFRRHPECSWYPLPLRAVEHEALPKPPIPPIGVTKVYFCDPFSLQASSSPASKHHRPPRRRGLNIPDSPIVLRRALDPFDATVNGLQDRFLRLYHFHHVRCRCNYSFAGGLAPFAL
jgi:hypothetical protein